MLIDKNARILKNYLPEAALDKVLELFYRHPCHLKIVNSRRTKHGDFRVLPGRNYQISINYDLNKYRFLLTLIHELAHLVTYVKHRRVKPHGTEWKHNFRELMLPFLNPGVFPDELLPILAHYLRNPKASTDTDLKLSAALKRYDDKPAAPVIADLKENNKFVHNNKIYRLGEKRRTRYVCTELHTGKKYLFHQHAEIKPLED